MQENINALSESIQMFYHAIGIFRHHPVKIHYQIKKNTKQNKTKKKTQALALFPSLFSSLQLVFPWPFGSLEPSSQSFALQPKRL